MADERSADDDPLARHSLTASELKALIDAERGDDAFLAYRDGDGRLQFLLAGERGERSTLGRRAEADLLIPWDPEVSGLHAELHHVGGEWTVVDDGLSTNGTYVDGKRISGRQRLRDGSRIRVGRTVLAYRAAQLNAVGETVLEDSWPPLQLTDMQRRVLVALCRPYREDSFRTPATNQQIAAELSLSVEAVKMHLRTLFGKFALGELPQGQKRARLAERALKSGAISRRDLG